MDKTRWIVVALVLVVLLGGAYFIYSQYGGENAPEVDYTTQQGDPSAAEVTAAPDFIVTDESGAEVALSDHIGKPVVLNFWASWCPPCKSEMPDFEEAYLEHGDEVVFLMVNLTDGSRETVETAAAFIAEKGFTFPVYYDVYMEGAYGYQVSSIPSTYFIDAEGNIAAYAVGALSKESLLEGIEMIR